MLAERTPIVGVDYSGAANNNATGYTRGSLLGNTLTIQHCERLGGGRQIAHRRLEGWLMQLVEEAIPAFVAMDFPFSLPQRFGDALTDAEGVPPAADMSGLWALIAREGFTFNRFQELRDEFVIHHGELIRRGDARVGGPFSPLHDVRPSMLQMTFYGMQMLSRLRQAGCRVPPLLDGACTGPVLLEIMPGVLLRAFDLPAENYKKPNATNNRKSGGGAAADIRWADG